MSLFTKQFIYDSDYKNKKILLHIDLHCPIYEDKIIDDTKIQINLPFIKKLLLENCSIIILNENGNKTNKFISDHLQTFISNKVTFCDQNYTNEIIELVQNLKNEVLFLENTNSIPKNVAADQLALFWGSLCDFFVYDSLNDAEKKLPSSYMIAKYYPKKSFIGPLCKKELDNVKTLTINSMHPTTYVIGGSHIYNKINAIYSAANHLDYLLVGGITSFTFLKMYDIDVPYYEEGTIDEVHNVSLILKKKIYMPLDFLETDSLSNISGINEVLIHDMHSNNVIGDIGQKTINEYLSILDTCKSVLFYGPVGLCEINEFQNGTYQILNKLKELTTKGVYTFIGGIELIIAMKALGFNASDFSYVSVAGNNTLSLLEHIILPILEIIPNKS